MNVLALVGSLRKKSYNRMVFEHYRRAHGSLATFVDGTFSDFPLYNEDLHTSGFPDPVLRLADQVRAADGVIFFSPEYNYSVPGALKNAIDWLSRLPDKPFAAMPATVVGASPGKVGTARMQYHLRQVGVFLDLHFMTKPEVMISECHKIITETGEITDGKTKEFLHKHFMAFAAFMEYHQVREARARAPRASPPPLS